MDIFRDGNFDTGMQAILWRAGEMDRSTQAPAGGAQSRVAMCMPAGQHLSSPDIHRNGGLSGHTGLRWRNIQHGISLMDIAAHNVEGVAPEPTAPENHTSSYSPAASRRPDDTVDLTKYIIQRGHGGITTASITPMQPLAPRPLQGVDLASGKGEGEPTRHAYYMRQDASSGSRGAM